MRNLLLILIFALTIPIICNAQKIEIQKVFGGYKFTQNEKNLTMSDLVIKMEANTEAQSYIKKAKSTNALASVLGGIGGGLIGYPIGTAMGGGEANWTLVAIGAGIVAISIPITSKTKKNARKAVDLYNSSLLNTSHYEFKPHFKVLAAGNGIGLSMNF
jgi:hypothetical protein